MVYARKHKPYCLQTITILPNTPSEIEHHPPRYRTPIAILILAAITLLVYAPVVGNEFIN